MYICTHLLTHCGPETPKWVLWQTVKTQPKCCIMRHSIRVYIVCLKKLIFRERNVVFGILTYDPSIYTMDHPDLTVSNFMGISIGTQKVKCDFTAKMVYTLKDFKNAKIEIHIFTNF